MRQTFEEVPEQESPIPFTRDCRPSGVRRWSQLKIQICSRLVVWTVPVQGEGTTGHKPEEVPKRHIPSPSTACRQSMDDGHAVCTGHSKVLPRA